MKFLEYLAAAYLGFALTMFAGLKIVDWQFWAIIVPYYLLLYVGAASKEINKNKN